MRYQHSGNTPVYAPNSYGGPRADPGFAETVWGREVLSDADRQHLVSNILGHATIAATSDVQKRVVDYWTQVDSELGSRVAQGIQSASGSAQNGAGASNARAGEAPVGSSASTGL
jgi:catalase